MESFLTKAAVSKLFVVAGLLLASFSLFLHPMDPMEFLKKLVGDPANTFDVLYHYVQTVVFFLSVACTMAGILGMLLVAVQRWRRKRLFCRAIDPQSQSGDGEENWMFL